jgi:SSS family solute:Na+ symporter
MVGIDWFVIVIYFALVFGVAIWAYMQERGDETAARYFLGGRNVGWFVVGASLFVSNIGSEHLVGLSGTGADSGLAVGQFKVASLVLLALGWVFVPSTSAAACSRCPSSSSAGTHPPPAST